MSWVIISIIPAFFWAITNLIDQHLSRRFFKTDAVGLQATTGTFTFLSGLAIFAYSYGSYDISALQIISFLIIGALYNLAHIPYIKALQIDEAKIVIPLFQMIPAFVFIIAWLFLGERLNLKQLIGGAVIMISAIALMIDFKSFKIKYKTLFLMLITSLALASLITLNRAIVLETHWLTVSAYIMMGSGIFSTSIFLFNRKSLYNTISLFRDNSYKIAVFFIGMELVGRSAMLLYQKALAIAPAVSMVQVIIGGTQSVFIYILTIIFAFFIPSTIKRINYDKSLIFQILIITAMAYGVYLLVL